MSSRNPPLPKCLHKYLECIQHPGLLLDKFASTCVDKTPVLSQEVQLEICKEVANCTQGHPWKDGKFSALLERRAEMLTSLSAVVFEAETVGSFTLHLARASALENAGLCLHAIYGFPYIPGTGLKGLARSWAETVWFPAQYQAGPNGEPIDKEEKSKAQQAWQKIHQVFGYSPISDKDKRWKPKSAGSVEGSASGNIVFHDAWPTKWPRLIPDVLNNHYPNYYDGKDYPGDWENPVPVYFLAIPSGQSFQFALSKRRPNVPDELLQLAVTWLIGALTHFGAGAKTNTGYGTFRITRSPDLMLEDNAWQKACESCRRKQFEATVELVTPAFIGGAIQFGAEARDLCTLRPASLRGLLRWWWRTMHAGFLDKDKLLQLENALWGSTNAAGAIRIEVEELHPPRIIEANLKEKKFLEEHNLKNPSELQQEKSQQNSKRRMTQGVSYAAYGMDEKVKGETRKRWYLESGQRWNLRIRTTHANFNATQIDSQDVLDQALAALWLLCHWGGVGSKARKGFGSLMISPSKECEEAFSRVNSLEKCRAIANDLRKRVGLGHPFNKELVESAAFGDTNSNWILQIEVDAPTNDPWQVLDAVGFAYQAVAQRYAHDAKKVALGLPRKIHGPKKDPLQGQKNHRPPQKLFAQKGKQTLTRYSSPVHIHVDRKESKHVVRVIAFPAKYLPDLDSSRQFLTIFFDEFEKHFRKYPFTQTQIASTSAGEVTPGKSQQRPGSLPKANDIVRAELVAERTKKGKWQAKEPMSGLVGPIINSDELPNDVQPGQTLELLVTTANERQIMFRYLTSEQLEEHRKKQARKGKRG